MRARLHVYACVHACICARGRWCVCVCVYDSARSTCRKAAAASRVLPPSRLGICAAVVALRVRTEEGDDEGKEVGEIDEQQNHQKKGEFN